MEEKIPVCMECGQSIILSEEPEPIECLLNPGDHLGQYRITKLLGRGGMAEVYLSEHTLLNTKCALKLMRTAQFSNNDTGLKRFLREAKLTCKLKHPNLVAATDAGFDPETGLLFIAMEYIEGKDLSEIIRTEPLLPEKELKKIFLSVLGALQALDNEKIIHRDIKPSNIMRTTDGNYKLMDLGIARVDTDSLDGELTLTLNNSVVGTVHYVSPEQCQASHDVDIRSDIYSLGATLYHIASGKTPYDGTSTIEIIINILDTSPVPLKELRPDLSKHFISIIENMMEKSPDDRPGSLNILEASYKNPDTANSVLNYFRKIFRKYCCSKYVHAVFAGILLLTISIFGWNIFKQFTEDSPQPFLRSAELKKLPLLAQYNFKKDFNLEKGNVMIHTWTPKGRLTEYELARNLAVPDMSPNGFTVSFDYKFDPSANRELEWRRVGYLSTHTIYDFAFGQHYPLKLCIYDEKVILCANHSVIRTNKQIKPGVWNNYTISYDKENDLLTLYINKEFISSCKLYEKLHDPKNEFSFLDGFTMEEVVSSFRDFKCYNGVLTVPKNSTPEKIKKRYSLGPYYYERIEDAIKQAEKKNKQIIVAISYGTGPIQEWYENLYSFVTDFILFSPVVKKQINSILKKDVHNSDGKKYYKLNYECPEILLTEIVLDPNNPIPSKIQTMLKKWDIETSKLPAVVILESSGKFLQRSYKKK